MTRARCFLAIEKFHFCVDAIKLQWYANVTTIMRVCQSIEFFGEAEYPGLQSSHYCSVLPSLPFQVQTWTPLSMMDPIPAKSLALVTLA